MSKPLWIEREDLPPLRFVMSRAALHGTGVGATITTMHGSIQQDGTLRDGQRVHVDHLRLDKAKERDAYAEAVLRICADKKLDLPETVTRTAISECLATLLSRVDPIMAGTEQPDIVPADRVVPDPSDETFVYAIRNGMLYYGYNARLFGAESTGVVFPRQVMNAVPKISADLVLDDGAGAQERWIEVTLTMAGQSFVARLPIAEARGARFIKHLDSAVGARLQIDRRLRTVLYDVLQAFGTPDPRVIQIHTGWVRHPSGRWGFLDAVGDLLIPEGESGDAITVMIDPEEAIAHRYRVTRGLDPRAGWAALRAFMDVAARRITLPLVSCALLPPLHHFMGTGVRPMLWLEGLTGVRKTSLACFVCTMYGRFTADDDLYLWTSTAADMEATAHILKDVLLLVDNYKTATAKPAEVTSFIQAYGGSSGKGRRKGGMRPQRRLGARCIVVSTGENRPELDPADAARLLYVDVAEPDVYLDEFQALREAQETPTLHGLLQGFLRWLAARHDLQKALPRRFLERRTQVMADLKWGTNLGRVSESVSMLELAFESLMDYGREAGFITQSDADTLVAENKKHCRDLGRAQLRAIAQERPDTIFLSELQALLDSHQVTLDTKDHMSQKGVVGYRDERGIMLYCSAADTESAPLAYHAVVEALRKRGITLRYSWFAVSRALRDNGWIKAHLKGKYSTTRDFPGQRKRPVVHLRSDALRVPQCGASSANGAT